MKKLFIGCAMLLCSSALFAEFNFGVKGGYTSSIGFSNLSSVGNYTWENAKSEFGNGFHAGVFARIGNKLYVQPEFLYNLQKTDYEVTLKGVVSGEDLYVKKYVKASTLDVPILLGYRLFDLKIIDMRVLLGPKLRFNAGTKIEYKEKNAQEIYNDISDQVRKANIGLEAGIGFEIINRVDLDVRYNLISNISKETIYTKDGVENIIANYKSPLNTFVISLGVRIF